METSNCSKICYFASALCNCHHSQAEFDFQLFCHLYEKSTQSCKQDKFFQSYIPNCFLKFAFFMARAETLAFQDHHTNLSYFP